mgnify:FL=1
MRIIPVEELHALAEDVMRGIGCVATSAQVIAEHLVLADLHGVSSHGTMRLTQYAQQAATGYLDAAGVPSLHESDMVNTTLRRVDANSGFGHPAMVLAADVAIETCAVHGHALVAVTNCGHTGRLGHYSELLATQGLVSIIMGGGRWQDWRQVAPHGGIDPKLATNPYSFGFPGGEDGPLIADFATGATSGGRAMSTSVREELFDDPIVLDADGLPSRDPNAYLDGGAILPMAGPKGTGMGLMAELLASAMLGPDTPESNTLLIAIDPTRFATSDELSRRRDEIFGHVKSSRPAPGHDQVHIPGQRGFALAEERRRSGVPIPETVWREIQDLLSKGTSQENPT